jgi:hypothetical protein
MKLKKERLAILSVIQPSLEKAFFDVDQKNEAVSSTFIKCLQCIRNVCWKHYKSQNVKIKLA